MKSDAAVMLFCMSLTLVSCSPMDMKFTKSGGLKTPVAPSNHEKPADAIVALSTLGVDETIPTSSQPLESVMCSHDQEQIPVKVLFVVDKSGSNVQSFGVHHGKCDVNEGCVPATDPLKKFRGSSISHFFKKFKSKSNFSWGFVTFSHSAAKSYISTDKGGAFGDSKLMAQAITAFVNENDGGRTPYLEALKEVKKTIAYDPDLRDGAAVQPRYYVVFMSDGYATDAGFDELGSEVREIVNLSPAQVSFSAIYYGTQNDPLAAATLEAMARVGKGQFINVDTNKIDTFNIEDLITLPTTSCTVGN